MARMGGLLSVSLFCPRRSVPWEPLTGTVRKLTGESSLGICTQGLCVSGMVRVRCGFGDRPLEG